MAPRLFTLQNLLVRCEQEITPHGKLANQGIGRTHRLLKDPISDIKLSKLNSATIAEFRDRRMHNGVRPAQIDLILIRHPLQMSA